MGDADDAAFAPESIGGAMKDGAPPDTPPEETPETTGADAQTTEEVPPDAVESTVTRFLEAAERAGDKGAKNVGEQLTRQLAELKTLRETKAGSEGYEKTATDVKRIADELMAAADPKYLEEHRTLRSEVGDATYIKKYTYAQQHPPEREAEPTDPVAKLTADMQAMQQRLDDREKADTEATKVQKAADEFYAEMDTSVKAVDLSQGPELLNEAWLRDKAEKDYWAEVAKADHEGRKIETIRISDMVKGAAEWRKSLVDGVTGWKEGKKTSVPSTRPTASAPETEESDDYDPDDDDSIIGKEVKAAFKKGASAREVV